LQAFCKVGKADYVLGELLLSQFVSDVSSRLYGTNLELEYLPPFWNQGSNKEDSMRVLAAVLASMVWLSGNVVLAQADDANQPAESPPVTEAPAQPPAGNEQAAEAPTVKSEEKSTDSATPEVKETKSKKCSKKSGSRKKHKN